MIGAKLGHIFDKQLEPFAKKITLSPNTLTIAGLFVTIVAATVIPFNMLIGGLLVLIGGVFDMLDGVVARTNSKNTRFG
ncbi:MAG TPA: CDP-alcohol phosphatidyltransferase family protein, partial [Nitrospirae bacterium]|nr:CDP-alcohol phosphatidyltransferase family protein [Nitrospirota bacterium]